MRTLALMIGLVVCMYGCGRFSNKIQIDGATTGSPAFAMTDNLMGTILKSSSRSEVGNKLTFIGLKSKNPRVIYDGGVTSPLQKVYETDDSVTLLLVASASGSIDSFIIDKNTGYFAHVTAGTVGGVQASAAVGICR